MSKKPLLCILIAVNLIIPVTGYFIGSAIQDSAKEKHRISIRKSDPIYL